MLIEQPATYRCITQAATQKSTEILLRVPRGQAAESCGTTTARGVPFSNRSSPVCGLVEAVGHGVDVFDHGCAVDERGRSALPPGRQSLQQS